MTQSRRLPIDTDLVEDMERVIYWRLRHQMAFLFEVEMSAVQPLLPRGLFAVEARPGIALMFIGYNDYDSTGNLIDGHEQPRFQEMTRCFLVQPDLSIRMPVPRFCFFVHRIGANNEVFVDQEVDLLHLPSFRTPAMKAETNTSGTELWLRDEEGPIHHLKNTHPAPVYRNESFFGQYYTVENDKLWFGVWSWRGVACIHQRDGEAGAIFEHPFLTECEPRLAASSLGRTYQQVFTRPGELSEQRFYKPRLVRDLRETR